MRNLRYDWAAWSVGCVLEALVVASIPVQPFENRPTGVTLLSVLLLLRSDVSYVGAIIVKAMERANEPEPT